MCCFIIIHKKMHTPINSLITFILFPLLASVFIVIVIVLFKKYKFLSQVKVVISYYLSIMLQCIKIL